jgi:hypothetical protein
MSKVFGALAIGVAFGLVKFIATFWGYKPETRMAYLGLAIICGVIILILAIAEHLSHQSERATERDDVRSPSPPIQNDSTQTSNSPPLTNTADPVTTDQMPKQISDSSPTNGVDNTESPTTANKKDNFGARFYGSFFYESDLNKLLRLFVSFSFFDTLLSVTMTITGTAAFVEEPAYELAAAVFDVMLTIIFYILFKYWGIPKRSKLPFLLVLAVFVFFLIIRITDQSEWFLFQTYQNTLDTSHNVPLKILTFYNYFLCGMFFESIIVIRMLWVLIKHKYEKNPY